jgi:tryptophanyl-tRNA synthetase
MMRPALQLQEQGEAFLFIANYHALTTVDNAGQLRQGTVDVALDFLACGLNPERTTFFRQSDVPEVHELTWILSTLTPMGLLERCHSYKDKVQRGLDATHGLFAYPVLMAADILLYQSDIVPVGRDQKQHVEVTRDIAIKFNNRYGEVFKIPEPSIQEEVAVVPGVDGQKMSKSYDNTIALFGAAKEIKASIMGIVTDSTPLEAPKNPEECNVYLLYKLLATPEEAATMADKLRAGGYGYGHAKKDLLAKYHEVFGPMQARRDELADNMDYVEQVLRDGAARARAEAAKTLDKAREACGLA